MLRTIGVRLAVPLLTTILITSVAVLDRSAQAIDACRPTPVGIECEFDGTSTSVTVIGGGTLPPLRYLAVSGAVCWYWSRYPPGLDSWDSANDQSIILTRLALPECRARPDPPPTVVTLERAWEIFRAFPLPQPEFRLSPETGITNLPTRLHLTASRDFRHTELLPDRRLLEVEAHITRVWIDWGDDTPALGGAPSVAVGDPGPLGHRYFLKTCPAWYRADHLDGPKCHPTLDSYPVTVTHEWRGRYRAGGAWEPIGTIDRSRTVPHDVDEVLGVRVLP